VKSREALCWGKLGPEPVISPGIVNCMLSFVITPGKFENIFLLEPWRKCFNFAHSFSDSDDINILWFKFSVVGRLPLSSGMKSLKPTTEKSLPQGTGTEVASKGIGLYRIAILPTDRSPYLERRHQLADLSQISMACLSRLLTFLNK